MKIVKSDVKIVCDIKGCNNLARYRLIMDVGESDEMRLCGDCLKSFYRAAAKSIKEEKDADGGKK